MKNQTNAIGAIESNQLITVGLFDTSVNTAVFECWIEQDLLPKLTTTSVLIMDNTTFHKGKRLLKLIKAAGHYLIWLPTYSPDLNLIEKMWAWIKRKRKEWLVDLIDLLFKLFFQICMKKLSCSTIVHQNHSNQNIRENLK